MQAANSKQTLETLLARYANSGLYIVFDDGEELDLSREAIEAFRSRLGEDEQTLPLVKRAATDFQPCRICPGRGASAMCHALPAILPFVQCMNERSSFDMLVAVYVDSAGKDEPTPALHISRTPLSRALQYVAMESILWHCETGRVYFEYFRGVMPFSPARDVAERVYANVMLDKNGEAGAVDQTLGRICETMEIAMHCQLRRVRLVAESDAFANAFANLYLALQMLRPGVRHEVRERIARRVGEANP